MLTPTGVAHIWTLIAAELEQGGQLRVASGTSDDAQTAEAPVASASVERTEIGGGHHAPLLVVTANFDSGQANFEWQVTTVILPSGTELDVAEEDLGRKAGGSDVSLTVKLHLNTA